LESEVLVERGEILKDISNAKTLSDLIDLTWGSRRGF